MRDFFKQELVMLKAKTGLNQYEVFSKMPDAGLQLKTLLDAMVSVCDTFPHIPEAQKKEIISSAIISDPDFTGLNARTVFKWLQAKNYLYFKEMSHQKEESIVEPLKGQEMQRMLDEWKRELDGVSNNFSVPRLTHEEIEKEGQEDERALEAALDKLSPIREGWKQPSKETIEMQSRVRSIAGKLYKDRKDFRGLDHYYVEGIPIFCESQDKAQEIYIEANK